MKIVSRKYSKINLQIFTKWYIKYIIFGIICLFLLVVPLLKGPWIGTEPFLFHSLASDFFFMIP
jgi:hypothetical protein